MASINNKALKEALRLMREDVKDAKRVSEVANLLYNGQVMAPATWDKEPIVDENGTQTFPPQTKFSLMVLTNQDGQTFFPMFTDAQSIQAWNPDQKVQCLVLNWKQMFSFLDMAKDQITGIVLNPGEENLPFTQDFLKQVNETLSKPRLNASRLNKGETVYLRDSKENISDLKLALRTVGELLPEIQALYLKERVDSPEAEDNSGHWFIIVDTKTTDPELFSKIGQAIGPFSHGKEMEFLFSSAKLAQNIMAKNEPVYARTMN